MENIKVNISIGGRVYPMSVNPSEEWAIREAGKKINDLLLNFEKKYAVRDKQDAMAMTLIQLGSSLEKLTLENLELNEKELENLQNIKNKIDSLDSIFTE